MLFICSSYLQPEESIELAETYSFVNRVYKQNNCTWLIIVSTIDITHNWMNSMKTSYTTESQMQSLKLR